MKIITVRILQALIVFGVIWLLSRINIQEVMNLAMIKDTKCNDLVDLLPQNGNIKIQKSRLRLKPTFLYLLIR